MTATNQNLSRLQFKRVRVPEGHGADDYESDEGEAYTLHAYRGGRPVGSLDYNLTNKEAHVRWVESHARGTGVGGGLVSELRRRHPDHDLTTNGYTDEGEVLRHRIER